MPSHKTLTVTQQGMQYAGRLTTGSDLTFNMAANSQQIANIAESNYRDTLATTATHTRSANTKDYTYDANGNLLTVISNSPSGVGGSSSRRGLLWDEENHLLALSDNGYVSTYWYDAAGERTVKQSGDALSMAVNGTLSGASTGTTNFTAYVNPYTVINNGNQMSKHIYMGTQRILSKLCDAGTMADPTKATKAAGGTTDYAKKYTALTATVKARYDSLGVAYNGVDNKGATFYKASPGGGLEGLYYYHSDQLGSANYITDANGDVAQHLEYIPYGETFVDERYNNWHTPYVFNGKERDEETGLTYYGARYFDGNVWLSVDPLAHKYPNVSSYVYCMANPVKYVDPDGRDVYLIFDGAKQQLQVFDDKKTPGNAKDDKLLGTYPAHNNVASKSQGKWEDGNYKFVTKTSRHTHQGKDKKGVPLDSPNGSYGTGGSYTAETFKEKTTGKTRSGMSVHAGREKKPFLNRVTEGCVRTTPDGMTGIDNAIKNYGPLQSITIQNNRKSTK